ncbi:MAG: hypothetical protein AAGC68_00735 [Verrucomicrobiota bacterium]
MKKQRSPRFPFIPLEEAVEILRKLEAFQSDSSQPLKRPELLKALDYASFHGIAAKTVAALRAYDLLEKKEEGVAISGTGQRILHPSSPEDRVLALQRAALSPLVFRMLWRRARHRNRAAWKEMLLERDFTEAGAKRASRIYRQNDELAGLQSIEVEPDLPERGAKKPVRAAQGGAEKRPQRKRARRAARQAGADSANATFLRLPLSSGTAVIPAGMSEKEFQTLMQTMRLWKDRLVAGGAEAR